MSVLVGRKAPDFTANAVLGDGQIVPQFNFEDHKKGKYAIVFFYPLNFTFVCPTELIALDANIEAFKSRQVEIVGVSIDSHFSHHAWRNTDINKGGIGQVRFPLVADIDHAICQSYGIEHPEANVALRAAFLVDKDGKVRAQIVNDLPIGRSMEELLRLVDALQYHEEHGEVCPAGWKKGKAGMTATPKGVAAYLSEHEGDLR